MFCAWRPPYPMDDAFEAHALGGDLMAALEAVMPPGTTIAVRRCAGCKRLQGFSIGGVLAPTWDRPMEFRATGQWYAARRKHEHDHQFALACEAAEVASHETRAGRPTTVADALAKADPDQTAEAGWYIVGDRVLCYPCSERFKSRLDGRTSEVLEAMA